MCPSTQINSGDTFDDININFRVTAGPGAGKTYWLVRHIKNVLQKTNRLNMAQKIACVSYTNVAVNEMRQDLHDLGIREGPLEISTIHSFLYHNVVRPYLWVIEQSDPDVSIAQNLIDSHEEHTTGYVWIKRWFEKVGGNTGMISTHLEDWTEYLEKSSWIKSENNGWEFGRNVPYSPKYLPTTDLNSYKKPFWERGILHHEDVLYFAYKIFDSHPQLFDPLSARFPYLFVDEFQDTQPAQAKLVKELADHGTKVGVIGDAEQAIYGFRGATDEVLKNISSHEKYGIGEIEEYKIIGNRRSTTAIVNFLNQIRSDDLEQNAINPPNINESLKCIFGDKNEVLSKTKDYLYQSSNSEDLELAVLAWRNDDVSNFCVLNSGIEPDIDETWELFRENDSNSYRRRLVKQALRAVKILNLEEDGDSQRSGIAIREMKKAIRVRDGSLRKPFNQTANVSKLERRALAMETVRHFSTAVENDSSQNLYEAYSRLDERLSSVVPGHGLTGYGRGNTRSFAESVSLQELLDSVYTSQPEGNEIRTIHKAKGAEFDNVLVWFPEENVLKEVLEGESSEQRKIYYVAMSRAKHRLFFGVGTNDLSSETESVLNKLDVECLSVSDG